MPESLDPAAFAQRQLEAYNDGDLERFVREYTDDVVVYRFPSNDPVLVGKPAFTELYRTNRFSRTGVKAEVLSRIVVGNKVIDHERVTGAAGTSLEVAAIYEVTPTGISKVWFVSGQ
jgi:hypothetical protein